MRRKTSMKNTLAALLLLCSTTPALAQDKVKLTSNEGEIVWFTLGQDLDKAEVPYVVVRYDYQQGNGYIITTPNSSYTFSFDANWSLELIPDPATGIDEVSATNSSKQVLFSLNGRKLYIKKSARQVIGDALRLARPFGYDRPGRQSRLCHTATACNRPCHPIRGAHSKY